MFSRYGHLGAPVAWQPPPGYVRPAMQRDAYYVQQRANRDTQIALIAPFMEVGPGAVFPVPTPLGVVTALALLGGAAYLVLRRR